MANQTQITAFECPTDEIAAYIDGELDPSCEFELEAHFATCEVCSYELNQQKQFLCGLNSSLKHEKDIELPANFTKLIVANAESTVSGLRPSRERYNALFICAALFLFVLFAMGADAGKVFDGVYGFFGQIAIVGGFFGHLIYSVFIGVVIVLRSFASQFQFDVVMSAAAAFVIGSLVFVSRKVLRPRRA